MAQERYMLLNGKYLEDAEHLLEAGDSPQASEKLWGAVAEMVKAVAARRGWRHFSHRELWDVVQRLSRESGDDEIVELFGLAESLHANFYENYRCGSPRNYTDYCSELVDAMMDKQSAELDPKKRLQLVYDIQKKLEEEAARPMMGWRVDYFTHWPYVKNLIPHQSIYNYWRMQEVWLDK